MAADHLVGDPRGHLVEVEEPRFFRHLRVVDHLEQEIAQLVLELVEIAARDRIGDLVGLLDGIGRDGREILLEVPGAAAVGIAQARHHPEQPLDRGPVLRDHSRRLCSPAGGASDRAGFGPGDQGRNPSVVELDLERGLVPGARRRRYQVAVVAPDEGEAAREHALVAQAGEQAG